MKKLILSLFLFCSVFAFSQGTIPIPQIIGLPAALASKVDKVTGKSLVADTSIVKLTGIQASAQVNKIEGIQKNGVDLTITGKKVNITVPTTATEIGAQPAGTYATGTGTAYNSNNGDETLTSIKTKLGAATSVSDGYLKYQDYVKFDGKLSSEVDGSTTNELQTISTTGAAGNITLSSSGGTLNLNVNDADASPTNEIQDLSLTGNILTLSSDAPVDVSQATAVQANTAKVSNATHTGDVTGSTALTLATVNSNIGTFNNVTINAKGLATAGSNVSYEPAFSKNTAFNKNFGTTTGTVLEGRTFGTAANSSVGDFQPALSLSPNYILRSGGSGILQSSLIDISNNTGSLFRFDNNSIEFINRAQNSHTPITFYASGYTFSNGNVSLNSSAQSTSTASGALTIVGGVGVGGVANLGGSRISGDGILSNGAGLELFYTASNKTSYIQNYHRGGDNLYHPIYIGGSYMQMDAGNVGVGYATDQGYKLAVNGAGFFNGAVTAPSFSGNGSNLTGVQLPITLTTNGTSGAATFENGVMNVPNYTSNGAYVNISPSSAQSGSIWIDGIVNSSTVSAPSINTSYINFNSIPNGQQTSGSVSGNVIFNMPFNGAFYKKVIITLLNLQGSASWTFTSSFSNLPVVLNTDGLPSSIVTSKSLTSITLNCATPTSGILILEGY